MMRSERMPFWQCVEHTRTSTRLTNVRAEQRMYGLRAPIVHMCELQNWSSWSQFIGMIATREPCARNVDALHFSQSFSVDQLEGAAQCFCMAGSLVGWLVSSNAYRADAELGMLRRLIWSIMHKSTCFNFAWKTNQYLSQFLSINLAIAVAPEPQIVAMFLCIVFSSCKVMRFLLLLLCAQSLFLSGSGSVSLSV